MAKAGGLELRQSYTRLAKRLFLQKRDDKNTLYSLHAPEVECIAKGKAQRKVTK